MTAVGNCLAVAALVAIAFVQQSQPCNAQESAFGTTEVVDEWLGSTLEFMYPDSYCSGDPILQEEIYRITKLADGDFCTNANFSGWGFSGTLYTRMTLSCTAPDGSGESGIYMALHNCTAADCGECLEDTRYLLR